jgi:hypothetical protein
MIDERSGVLIPADFATRIRTDRLIPVAWNPNKQNDKTFNNLVENIQLTGFDEAIEVVPLDEAHEAMRQKYLTPDQAASGELYYLIVGGHHRWEAAKVLDMEFVPVVIKHGYDEDMVKFQNVRKNMLRGKIDPVRFTQLYDEMSDKYGEELVKEQMALLDDRELKNLVIRIKDDLPPELRDKIDDARDDIKSVDDLSRILNELFSKYGDTLQHSYMVFDFGGKTHYWVQMEKPTKKGMDKLAAACYDNGVNINAVFERVLAQGMTVDDAVAAAVAAVPVNERELVEF